MSILHQDIEKIKSEILQQGMLVEESLEDAVTALQEMSPTLAQAVLDKDDKIDNLEVKIENECLKILTLHQPVAIDLRFLMTAMKINNELERIGDLSVNIAQRSLDLYNSPRYNIPFDFKIMSKEVGTMLKMSLDALVYEDEKRAKEVLFKDDEVDEIHRKMYGQVKKTILEDPDSVNSMIHYLSVSKHLERIADHAEAIAQDVLYMIRGRIVRHKNL